MNRSICAQTARSRAVTRLLGGAGSAVLALVCRWAMTDFAAPGEGAIVTNRYTPFLFLFSAVFAVLALWLLFQGLRDLLAPGFSTVAKSVRSQLTPEELRLPLKEQFALADHDLTACGKALAGGKVLIGREWVFAKNADLPAMRLANAENIAYRQTEQGALCLCLRDRKGNELIVKDLSSNELELVQTELQARLSPMAE